MKFCCILTQNIFLLDQMRRQARTADTPKKSRHFVQGSLLMLFMLIAGMSAGYYLDPFNSNSNSLSKVKLKSTMMSLKTQFPSLQQGLLKKLSGAFTRLRKPGEPIVFMLLHDDTNKKSTDCLVSYASVSAKKYIFTNSLKSLWINGSDWASYSDEEHENLLYEKVYNSYSL